MELLNADVRRVQVLDHTDGIRTAEFPQGVGSDSQFEISTIVRNGGCAQAAQPHDPRRTEEGAAGGREWHLDLLAPKRPRPCDAGRGRTSWPRRGRSLCIPAAPHRAK